MWNRNVYVRVWDGGMDPGEPILMTVGQKDNLPRRGVPTAVCVLWGICAGDAGECLPGYLGGFFTRLFEVAVVSPERCSVFASLDDDAARPSRSDA